MQYVKTLCENVFVYPLRLLFFQGPRVWGWGGWEGIQYEDICAQMTQVPAHVWREQMFTCAELLERKFTTFLVTVGAATYGFVLYKILSYLWFRYFILGPILHELKLWKRDHLPAKNVISASSHEQEKAH